MKQFKHYQDAKISRRTFLSGGALIGAGAVAAAIAPNMAAAASETQIEVENKPGDKQEDGYRLTQHIADYYKSTAL